GSPAVTANAPVDADAPVCVASDCSGASAGQQGGSGGSSTQTSDQSQTGGQTSDQSIGTVQVNDVNGSPAVAGNAPVNANTGVCVASDCSGSNASQESGGGTSQTGGGGGGGSQTADQSIATGQ